MGKFLSKKQVCVQRGGKSTNSHDDDVRAGLWTEPVKDNRRAIWPEAEVEIQLAARAAGESQEQLKELVKTLHKKRKEAVEKILAGAA